MDIYHAKYLVWGGVSADPNFLEIGSGSATLLAPIYTKKKCRLRLRNTNLPTR